MCIKWRKKSKDLHSHLWRHFELHANQRVQLFRFYVIFLTLALGGMGFLLLEFNSKTPFFEIAGIILSILLAVITHIFQKIDKRNKELVDYSKEGLKKFEIDSYFIDEYKIFNNDKKEGRNTSTHAECYKLIFWLSYSVAFIFALIIAFLPRIIDVFRCSSIYCGQ